eukprot:2186078-Amphidinium_carterae.1
MQWHCPACGDKWSGGTGLPFRLLVVYGEQEEDNVCYRMGTHPHATETWAENVLDYLRKVELVHTINAKPINWHNILKALGEMDERNFQKLSQVLQPVYRKPCRPGDNWWQAEIHCPDP